MNIETLSDIRSKLAQVAALMADGLPLENACGKLDITVRTYRRWTEVVEFTRADMAPADLGESFLSLLQEFETAFGRMTVRAGETLFEFGGPADYMYIVVSGAIDLIEWDADISPGEIVGEIGVFSDARRHATTAITAEDCELVRIPCAKALEVAGQRSGIALSILQVIADQLARNAPQMRAARTQRIGNRIHYRQNRQRPLHGLRQSHISLSH